MRWLDTIFLYNIVFFKKNTDTFEMINQSYGAEWSLTLTTFISGYRTWHIKRLWRKPGSYSGKCQSEELLTSSTAFQNANEQQKQDSQMFLISGQLHMRHTDIIYVFVLAKVDVNCILKNNLLNYMQITCFKSLLKTHFSKKYLEWLHLNKLLQLSWNRCE